MLPALLTGQIDGFMHSEPTTTLAIVNKAGHFSCKPRAATWVQPAAGNFDEFATRLPPDKIRSGQALHARHFGCQRSLCESSAEMTPIVAEWSGQDEKIVATAQERMNPTTQSDDSQAQKWWDFIANRDGTSAAS